MSWPSPSECTLTTGVAVLLSSLSSLILLLIAVFFIGVVGRFAVRLVFGWSLVHLFDLTEPASLTLRMILPPAAAGSLKGCTHQRQWVRVGPGEGISKWTGEEKRREEKRERIA